MREEVTKVRELLANKDDVDPEALRTATTNLQQGSLKLFEQAYKKVSKTWIIASWSNLNIIPY